ncbi:hypothetical protein L6164_013825 [Bauhinia variegata]|uniref:Uncharacterized protein n=1 Tax=Bauhinia variegata TaxID=167791 RepID=A0ACB9NFK0_BAUVA|nr:hypothetical protein L6164_013825 [Bauhinia variegata]
MVVVFTNSVLPKNPSFPNSQGSHSQSINFEFESSFVITSMTSLEEPLNRQTRPSKKPKMVEPVQFPPSIEVVDVESFYFTPISNKGTNQSNAISVEQYADHRDLNLAIMDSLGKTKPTPETLIDLSDGEDDDEVRILKFKPEKTPFGKRRNSRNPFVNDASFSEKGESSNSPPFVCEICTETKTVKESFSISGCSHAYCTECITMYVASRLQENIINIRCPVSECKGLLEPHDCRSILPPEVFDRWGNAMCEAVILASEKFYCPFKDCSALLIDDGNEVVKESECPNCKRFFCAQCKVPWHSGMDCTEFQKLNKDEREMEDILLMELAHNKKWRRCPKCKFYVEKSEGCMYMKCRCGVAFCYSCGTLATTSSHYCSKCRR